MSDRRRQRHVVSLLAGSALVVLAANGVVGQSPSAPASGGTGPRSGGAIAFGVSSDTPNLLPQLGDFGPEQTLMALTIYDGLSAVGEDYTGHPFLAESMTPSDDLTAWTVTLRPDITFSDGTPLDAAALKEIFDTYLQSEDSNVADALEGVTATVVDPLTVTYSGLKPSVAFPETMAFQNWPFSPTAAAAAGADAGLKPSGAGPFVVESYTAGESLAVTRNPAYWQQGLPYLDRIEFHVIPDDQTRFAAFQSGELDGFTTTNPSTIKAAQALQAEGKATVVMQPSSNGYAVLFNTQRPPFDDVRIRKALTQAIDQGSFILLRDGTNVLSTKDQLFSPASPWHSDEVGAAYPAYDPAAAAALVEAYRNDPTRSDGRPVGDPVTVSYTCPRDAINLDVNQALVDAWANVGFEASWPTTDDNEFIFKVLGPLDGSEGQFVSDFDTACWALGEMLFDPANWLSEWFGQPVATSIVNVTDFENEQFATDLAALHTERDPAERRAIMDRIGTLLNTELPNAWLTTNETAIVVRPGIHDVGSWTLPDGSQGFGVVDGITYLSHAWVDE